MTSAMISPTGELADTTIDISDIKSWKDDNQNPTSPTSAAMAIAGMNKKAEYREKNKVKNIVKGFVGANEPVKIPRIQQQNTDLKTNKKAGLFNLTQGSMNVPGDITPIRRPSLMYDSMEFMSTQQTAQFVQRKGDMRTRAMESNFYNHPKYFANRNQSVAMNQTCQTQRTSIMYRESTNAPNSAAQRSTFGTRNRSVNYRLNPVFQGKAFMNKTTHSIWEGNMGSTPMASLQRKKNIFPNVQSKVGAYIGGFSTVVTSGKSPRKIAELRNAKTAEEIQGDMSIQQLDISTFNVPAPQTLTYFRHDRKNNRRSPVKIAKDRFGQVTMKNYELGRKTFLMNSYEQFQGTVMPYSSFQELSVLEYEMALRMRTFERHQYQAARLIQAVWKGFQTRKEIDPQLASYKRGVFFLTTFLRGKIDRTRLRLKRDKAATILQKICRKYLVFKSVRFIKCESQVTQTLDDFITMRDWQKHQCQRLIRFRWRIYLRVKERKAEAERKRKAKLAAKKKKKKRGGGYASFKTTAAATTPKKPTAPLDVTLNKPKGACTTGGKTTSGVTVTEEDQIVNIDFAQAAQTTQEQGVTLGEGLEGEGDEGDNSPKFGENGEPLEPVREEGEGEEGEGGRGEGDEESPEKTARGEGDEESPEKEGGRGEGDEESPEKPEGAGEGDEESPEKEKKEDGEEGDDDDLARDGDNIDAQKEEGEDDGDEEKAPADDAEEEAPDDEEPE